MGEASGEKRGRVRYPPCTCGAGGGGWVGCVCVCCCRRCCFVEVSTVQNSTLVSFISKAYLGFGVWVWTGGGRATFSSDRVEKEKRGAGLCIFFSILG